MVLKGTFKRISTALVSMLLTRLIVPLVLIATNTAWAYPQPDSCISASCHTWDARPYISPTGHVYTGNQSMHDAHRAMGIDDGVRVCNLCHFADRTDRDINASAGSTLTPGLGCAGCHARVHSGRPRGYGLREAHTDGCLCHHDIEAPAPESVLPPYYGSPECNIFASCNDQVSEDWSGDGLGLDNDGDGYYDLADPDCGALCGNNTLDPGETCDPPRDCPQTCWDGDPCTNERMIGSPSTCTASCAYTLVTLCQDGDACCPSGCHPNFDDDCEPVCGDHYIDANETCDPPESCPTDCSDTDPCTQDFLTGSAALCTVLCLNLPQTRCEPDDSCCPAACTPQRDPDCVVDAGFVDAGDAGALGDAGSPDANSTDGGCEDCQLPPAEGCSCRSSRLGSWSPFLFVRSSL